MKKQKEALFDSESSESESGDEGHLKDEENNMPFIPAKRPQDEIWDRGLSDMKEFMDKLNKFQHLTGSLIGHEQRVSDRVNTSLNDLWRIKDIAFQPLKVQIDVQEYIPGLFDVLKPNAKIEMSKVMSVFCFLQIETFNLKFEIESKFFDPLIFFGENGLVFEDESAEESKAGEQEIQMSRMLSVYKDLFDTIKKIVSLTKNIIYQMNGLFNSKSKMYSNFFKKIIYHEIFNNLGSILSTLYIVDLIIIENTNFQSYWEQYNRMFLIAKNDPNKYNVTDRKIKKLQKFCNKIYSVILCGQLYNNYLEQLYKVIFAETGKEMIFKNKEFAQKYLDFIKYKIDHVTVLLQNPADMNSHNEFMNLLINYSLYRKLFGNDDSKLFKKIWSLQKLCPIIILYNNLCLNAGTFLINSCPLKKKTTTDPKDIKSFLIEQAQLKTQNFQAQQHQLYLKLFTWIVQMNSDALRDQTNNQGSIQVFLNRRGDLILNGLGLAIQIKRNLKNLILLNQVAGITLSQERLRDIVQSIEMLKAIELEFKSKRCMINQWVVLINRLTSESINPIMENGNRNLFSKMKKSPQFDDMLYLITTVLDSLKGNHNLIRRTAIRHCMNLVNKEIFSQSELTQIEVYNERLDNIANWEANVKKSTRCRFVYWIRSLFPLFFKQILADKHKLNQINFFLLSLNDPLEMLVNIKHLENSQIAIDNYKKEIYQAFSDNVIKPVCRKVEEELRLQIHQVIISYLKQVNPKVERVEDCARYTSMSDIFLFEKRISMAEEVKHYLSKIFYEMTALSPHDWKTYEHMRILAKEKYNIDVMPSHLPAQTIEQGVDILFLLRNLQSFVSKYHYNLHTQVFIETTKETKQVKTISVNQMLFSIKTHGVGILGTALNTFYKFLTKKFNIFSEFLYDEFIHNPLLQEQRFFNTNKEKLRGRYPYERAEKIAKAIKKLGTLKGGQTFLDKFRSLITQFGNVLGYIRMIRNASLKDNSNLIKFIPKLLDDLRFEDVAAELGIKSESEVMESCKMFDQCIRLLLKQAQDASDYLRILAKNFEGVFEGEECSHLKLFYIIIPPLTLNYIEHVQRAKEKLLKKNNKDAFLSDDGFPLGLAFILKILNQIDLFNGLNWFDSMKEKFQKDLDAIHIRTGRTANNQNTQSMVQQEENFEEEMSIKRITNLIKEFDMINYCFCASSILFKEI